jgi:uncharacterized protein (TIGR02217 family)
VAIATAFTGASKLAVDLALIPLGIQIECTGGPRFKTSVTESAGGVESRFSYYTQARREYSGAFGPDDVDEMLQQYTAGLGPRYGLMLFDPTDNAFTGSLQVKDVSGGNTVVQLQKVYQRKHWQTAAVLREHRRNILLPDPDTVVVYVNGSDATADFTLTDDGVLTSSTVYAADPGDPITVDCGRFFVPVRPSDDALDLIAHVINLNSIQQIRFKEVLPGDVVITP